jgi:hypothetical protein
VRVIQQFIQRISIGKHRRTITTLPASMTSANFGGAPKARLVGNPNQTHGEVLDGLHGRIPIFRPFFCNMIYSGYM